MHVYNIIIKYYIRTPDTPGTKICPLIISTKVGRRPRPSEVSIAADSLALRPNETIILISVIIHY